jgi:hypothetical protein
MTPPPNADSMGRYRPRLQASAGSDPFPGRLPPYLLLDNDPERQYPLYTIQTIEEPG